MATSILDFWTLICEAKCSVVVLVCPLFENDQVIIYLLSYIHTYIKDVMYSMSCKLLVSSGSIQCILPKATLVYMHVRNLCAFYLFH